MKETGEKGGREGGRQGEVKREDYFYTLFNFTSTDPPPPSLSPEGRSRFMAWVAGRLGPEPA